jgi:hypothetical protein
MVQGYSMMKFRLIVLLGLILGFNIPISNIGISDIEISNIGISEAQGICPTIVEQALQAIADNCDGLGRNSACYGYNLVTAEFSKAVDDDFFSQPADTAELGLLETIRTSEMSVDTSQWGIAVMNLQANIPNSIPGQSVKFVLLGDVEVESAIEPDGAFQAVDAITVMVTNGANIRSDSGLNYNVIGGAVAGDSLLIDGQSVDGNWYRTVVGSRIGWIFGELLEPNDSLASLPVIDGTQRSLMQSFYLRTGFGAPVCEEAPQDTLMIQGPKGIEIDLTVNGANISIGSTIMVRILPPGDIIEFIVIDGKMVIPGAGPNGTDLTIYENYRTTACLSEPDDRGVDGNSNDRVVGCGEETTWTSPEYTPDPDLGEAFCILENLPDNLLNYPINLQCPGEEPIQITINEPSDPSPPSATEEPKADTNLCSAGNAWDDGRCDSDYWWQAGYYFGLYEAGLITFGEIPPQFLPTNEEPVEEPTKEKKKKDLCQIFVSASEWEIYDANTGAYIKTVFVDPILDDCPF